MKTPIKALIVVSLAAAVIAAVTLKKGSVPVEPSNGVPTTTNTSTSVDGTGAKSTSVAAAKLPRLVDLGAGKCIPCKMMAPILEELKKEYAGRMSVEFIDVWVNPDAGKPYGIEVIPTQIFFDADGKELFRHVGFFAKADILGKWKELGVDLTGKPKSSSLTPANTQNVTDGAGAAVGMSSPAKEPISESTPGTIVDSLAEMDARFGDMNAVFLLIPGTNGLSSVNWGPMDRARRNLEAEWDIKLGVFALKPDSRDYIRIAKRESVGSRPAVMVILRNGSISVLSRELTETNLVQEFVYAVGTGGCCPLGDD